MGNIQSQLENNTATVAITTSCILIGGLYYYARSYQKQSTSKIQYADDLGCMLIPAELKHRQSRQKYSHEKMQLRQKGYDARHKVVTDSKLGRSTIMKCIGRVVASRKERHKLTREDHPEGATGTVFAAKDGYFLVITCAHSFLYKDTDDKKNQTYPIKALDHIYFDQIETFRDKKERPRIVRTYNLKSNGLQFTTLRNGDKFKYTTEDEDENDLAVLAFEDPRGYYKNIFGDEKLDDIVHLQPVEKIPKNVILTYNVYGYPCGKDELAQDKGVKRGELWGMRSESFSVVKMEVMEHKDEDSKEMVKNKYVETNKTYFYYNAIDTEVGQSGSAIYLCQSNGTYAIVGVHTDGSDVRNVGVALTEDKIKELCDPWNIYKKV